MAYRAFTAAYFGLVALAFLAAAALAALGVGVASAVLDSGPSFGDALFTLFAGGMVLMVAVIAFTAAVWEGVVAALVLLRLPSPIVGALCLTAAIPPYLVAVNLTPLAWVAVIAGGMASVPAVWDAALRDWDCLLALSET